MKKLAIMIVIFSFNIHAMDKKKPAKPKNTLLGTFNSWKSQKKTTNNYSTIEISIQNKKREFTQGKLKTEEYSAAVLNILQKSKLTEQEQIKLALKYKQE